jgi:hypothetical protein
MSFINTIMRAEGNKAIPATADWTELVNGGMLGIGSSVNVNVETFDQNGGSLGIQGLDYAVLGTEEDFDVASGAISLYNFMKAYCKAIEQGWDPYVSCWASETSQNRTTFNIQPKGGNGAPWPAVVSYELVRIRDWVIVYAAPVPVVNGGGQQSQPDVRIDQNAGSEESPAMLTVGGNWVGTETVSLRIDTDESDPVTVQVAVAPGDTKEDVAQKICDLLNARDLWNCETQDSVVYAYPAAPAEAVSVSATAVTTP